MVSSVSLWDQGFRQCHRESNVSVRVAVGPTISSVSLPGQGFCQCHCGTKVFVSITVDHGELLRPLLLQPDLNIMPVAKPQKFKCVLH